MDQTAMAKWTGSLSSTRLYVNVIYGTGLRADATATDGSNIPKGGSVPSHVTFNVGAEQSFRLGSSDDLKLRLHMVNLAD